MKMAAEPIMGTEQQNNYRAHHEIRSMLPRVGKPKASAQGGATVSGSLLLRGFSNAHGESAYPIVNLARIGPAITEN